MILGTGTVPSTKNLLLTLPLIPSHILPIYVPSTSSDFNHNPSTILLQHEHQTISHVICCVVLVGCFVVRIKNKYTEANVIDLIFLQGMKRSLAESKTISNEDYLIVDKPALIHIFPYRNNNSSSSNNNNNSII